MISQQTLKDNVDGFRHNLLFLHDLFNIYYRLRKRVRFGMPGTPLSKLFERTEENTEDRRPLLQESDENSSRGH